MQYWIWTTKPSVGVTLIWWILFNTWRIWEPQMLSDLIKRGNSIDAIKGHWSSVIQVRTWFSRTSGFSFSRRPPTLPIPSSQSDRKGASREGTVDHLGIAAGVGEKKVYLPHYQGSHFWLLNGTSTWVPNSALPPRLFLALAYSFTNKPLHLYQDSSLKHSLKIS